LACGGEREILILWDVNIQDLPQFVAGGCLNCGSVSNENAKKLYKISFWDYVFEEVINTR